MNKEEKYCIGCATIRDSEDYFICNECEEEISQIVQEKYFSLIKKEIKKILNNKRFFNLLKEELKKNKEHYLYADVDKICKTIFTKNKLIFKIIHKKAREDE